MKGLLRKMIPIPQTHSSIPDEAVVVVGEYSFATEYVGPPLNYELLPKAVPIDMKKIPTATISSGNSNNNNLLLPVVHPIEKRQIIDLPSPKSVITFEKTSGVEGDDGNCRLLLSGISSSSSLGFSNSLHDQSCEFSQVIDSSEELECSRELLLSSRLSSSSERLGLGVCNNTSICDEQSCEIGRLVDNLDCLEECKESLDYGVMQDWGSDELALGSCKVEDFGNVSERHVKKTAVVTFRDVESRSVGHEDICSGVDEESVSEGKEVEVKGKKGSCYRCLKGSRFTDKEVCIVCNAKYCSSCVLRAMGSMPEGRKCVICIGYPIDESKRGSLGKCSRILKRLLSELEIGQIMEAEKLCEANQLQAENIYVNGLQLCQDELNLLQGCVNPPSKLKPGRYWYDKVSGLWGKEGQKPYKVVSAHLNVGGPILPNASNGNTQVFVNNREITKVELRMLQLAGVQCAGNPHFWVNEDGSYQEEGQKNIKGNLWSKAGMKLVCSVLSLPYPSKAANANGDEVNDVLGRALPDYLDKRTLQKILLVGYKGSGTSTIFKQAKILYKASPFSNDEREIIKLVIQTNVYHYFGILLEGRERFEDESLSQMKQRQLLDESGAIGAPGEGDNKTIYSISPRLKSFSDWLLKVMLSGNLEVIFPAATREYAPLVEELWKDAAIKATFDRRTELQMLPGIASYFLERVADISRTDYEPSDSDILFAEGITSSNGLSCVDFSFPQSTNDGIIDAADQNESFLRYQLIRVHARGLGESCKWLEMFEDVRVVIFCVSLSDYDELCDNGNGAGSNKMLASRTLFENIITHPIFEQMDFLLILNKFDLFEKKIEQIPLNQCEWFNDFNPLTSRYRSNKSANSTSLAQQAFHYIAVKFKRHFSSITGRKLYVSLVNGLEHGTVDEALRYAREILKWDEERAYFSSSEFSIYSTEASTSV